MHTSTLLDEINRFRSSISARVQGLKIQAEKSQLTILDMERSKLTAKITIIQQGGMLPPDDQYGDWEYDSEDGEGRGISQVAALDAGKSSCVQFTELPLTTLEVIKDEKAKILEAKENINFEATIDKMLRLEMSEFAEEAKMTSVELSNWDRDTEFCLYTNLPISEAYTMMMDWFVKKFWEAVAEEEKEEKRLQKVVADAEEKESAASAGSTTKKPFVPICYTCKESGHVKKDCLKVDIASEGGVVHLGSRGQGSNRCKVCSTCNKPGHDEYCPLTHTEEEENACSHCGRDGHRVEGCWRLRPDLRRAYLNKRKPIVCKKCQQPSHFGDRCPDPMNTYKYGLRPPRF